MNSDDTGETSTSRAQRMRVISIVCLVTAVFVAIGLFIGTHLPPSKVPRFVLRIAPDKVLHCAGYGTLAFLLYGGIRRWVQRPWRAWIIVVLSAAILSALDEITQPLTGRDRDLLDFLASTGGAGLGAALALVLEFLARRILGMGRPT